MQDSDCASPSAEAAAVTVLIVAYRAGALLSRCLHSLFASESRLRPGQVVVVDNASPDDAATLAAEQYPGLALVRLHRNLGFAGGNEAGWRWIVQQRPRTRWLLLLNQDTEVEPGFLEPLLTPMRDDARIAATQPKLLLHGTQPALLNSAGNRSHFLGFGFTRGLGQRAEQPQFNQADELDFPSGAAVLLRTAALTNLPGATAGELFDPRFFLYMEDVDLGWRLRLVGHAVRYVPTSVVWHHGRMDVPARHCYHLERNRWWLLLSFYRWSTLLLLLPALVMMELGLLAWATSVGALPAKLRAMGNLLRPSVWRHLSRRRRALQAARQINDRQFMGNFASAVELPGRQPALLRYVGNPLLRGWWMLVRGMVS